MRDDFDVNVARIYAAIFGNYEAIVSRCSEFSEEAGAEARVFLQSDNPKLMVLCAFLAAIVSQKP